MSRAKGRVRNRIDAALMLLLDSGDITPMGARIITLIMEEEKV